MKKNKVKITIFTPTYNRKELLKRAFESLQGQTNKNFKWLIIDDGSTDNTKKEIEEIKKIANFEIIYRFQKNGGKHRAHNNAVKICDTDYFLILDSDDYLSKDAIEILNKKISIIDNMKNISGVIGNRCNHTDKKVIGKEIPNVKFASGNELYQKMGFSGDTLRMYKTEILKKYLFPEIKQEKFIYENVVFDRIDKEYKMLIIHEKLYFGEYQVDGYTNKAKKIRINNPIGYAISLNSSAETALSIRKRLNWTILYIIWCKMTNITYGYKEYRNKFLYIILYPIAHLFCLIKFPKFFFDILSYEREVKK